MLRFNKVFNYMHSKGGNNFAYIDGVNLDKAIRELG